MEAGAATQARRNRPLPTKNSARSAKDRLADGMEKASPSNLVRLVAVPPDSVSHRSAAEKSVVGARIAALSSGSGAGAAGSAAMIAIAGASRSANGVRGVIPPPLPARDGGAFYSNTASGSSRLSEPSKARARKPSAGAMRPISAVCATSASMTACTSAFPSSLPSPIIRS